MASISADDVQSFYETNGYFLARGVFTQEMLVQMESAFDQVVARLQQDPQLNNARWDGPQMDILDGGSSVILHTHNIQSYSGVWMQALVDNRFLDVAEAILGPDVILHHSKLFFKPSEKGSPFPMHQDWEHFPTQQDRMVAAVIHLSDTDESSGCLRLYPGSHRNGRLQGMRGDGDDYVPRDDFRVENATPVPAKSGDVLFFSYLMVHGSTPNRSSLPRKTVLVQLHPGSDRVVSGNHHTNVKIALRGMNHHSSRHVMGRIR